MSFFSEMMEEYEKRRKEELEKENDKLVDFFNNKIEIDKCFCFCGKKDFRTSADIKVDLKVSEDNATVPVLPIVCVNCGYTHFVQYNILKKWMDKEDAL